MRAHLAAIVDSSQDAILSKALDGTILSWNRGAERLYGYTVEEAIGESISKLVPADRCDEVSAILRRIMAGEAIDHFETRRVAKDGTVIPVSLTISPIRVADGRVVAASTIARDIRDRRAADELRFKLAAIVESTDDAILGEDTAGGHHELEQGRSQTLRLLAGRGARQTHLDAGSARSAATRSARP